MLDNYGTHKTAMIHDWLAGQPRFHLHFTPTSASWINQDERWFAAITERHIRRGTHRSTDELEEAIEEYLTAHNANPKPFIWTKSARGVPLEQSLHLGFGRRESGSANFSRSSLNRRRKCSWRICRKRKGKNGRTQEDVSAAGPAVGPDQGPLEQGRPSHCPGSRAGRRRSLHPRTTSSVRAGLSTAYSASAISPSTCTRRG